MKSPYQSAKRPGHFGFGQFTLGKTALTLLATLAIAAGASAQTQTPLTAGELVGFDVSGSGSSAAATPSPSTDPSVTATQLSRNTVTYSGATNSFSSTGWNNAATLDTTKDYIAFSVTAGASAVTFGSLQFAINGSNTAPNQGQWAYTLDGGSTFTLGTTGDGGAFTVTNAQKTGLAYWDFTDFTLASGSTVQFRFYDYGTTSINGGTSSTGGTVRINNITGNDLLLTDNTYPVPEPATVWAALGMVGVAGLVIYRRNQRTA